MIDVTFNTDSLVRSHSANKEDGQRGKLSKPARSGMNRQQISVCVYVIIASFHGLSLVESWSGACYSLVRILLSLMKFDEITLNSSYTHLPTTMISNWYLIRCFLSNLLISLSSGILRIFRQISIVNIVLLLLNIDVNELMMADIITAIIRPRKPVEQQSKMFSIMWYTFKRQSCFWSLSNVRKTNVRDKT